MILAADRGSCYALVSRIVALGYLWAPLSVGTWKLWRRPRVLEFCCAAARPSSGPESFSTAQASSLVPSDIPDRFLLFFFWHLKRYLSPDRDSSYTHTSTPLLSVPLLSGLCCEVAIHLTHLECDRWQHTEVKMNASHKRRWLEMPYGEGKERMTEKNIYLFLLLRFPISAIFRQGFHHGKVLGFAAKAVGRWQMTSNLRVIREFQMEFRECCKCVSPLHQNIKKGLWRR